MFTRFEMISSTFVVVIPNPLTSRLSSTFSIADTISWSWLWSYADRVLAFFAGLSNSPPLAKIPSILAVATSVFSVPLCASDAKLSRGVMQISITAATSTAVTRFFIFQPPMILYSLSGISQTDAFIISLNG